MHVIFTSSDQAILHFSRLEAWNYSKELWVNEVWHNPHFDRRLYASIHFLLGIEKDVITQDKFSRYFCIHCKNSLPIFYRKCERVQMRTWQTLRQAMTLYMPLNKCLFFSADRCEVYR